MIRTNDAGFMNEVANHASVRPWLGPDLNGALDSVVDFSALLSLPGAFALQNAHGGFVFSPSGENEYEVHTLFLPSGRGRDAFKAARYAGDYLFASTDCVTLYTQIPEGNEAARMLASFMGFRVIEPRASAWRDAGGKGDDMALPRARWKARWQAPQALSEP